MTARTRSGMKAQATALIDKAGGGGTSGAELESLYHDLADSALFPADALSVLAEDGFAVKMTPAERTKLAGMTPPSGAIVGTTDTQTLTNKSIDAAQLTGTIPVERFNEGVGATATTVLHGDGTWKTPAGGGAGGDAPEYDPITDTLTVARAIIGGATFDGDVLADPGATRLMGWDAGAATPAPAYFAAGPGLLFNGTILEAEVSLTNIATLTNKRLDNPIINGPVTGTFIANVATINAQASGYGMPPNHFAGSKFAVPGKQHLPILAIAMTPRTTNGAARGVAESGTNRVMRETLDFDAAVEEFAQLSIQMPKNWNGGTVTAQLIFEHGATATNFGVVWGISAVAIANDESADAAFGPEVTVAKTGGTAGRLYTTPESAAITIAGTPAAEEWVVFQFARKVANAADTLAVDARLIGGRIHYTVTAANVS